MAYTAQQQKQIDAAKFLNPKITQSQINALLGTSFATPTKTTTPTQPTLTQITPTQTIPTQPEFIDPRILQQQQSTDLQNKAATAYNAYASIANLGPTNPQVVAAKSKYEALVKQMGTSTYLPGFEPTTQPTTTTTPTKTTTATSPTAPTLQVFSQSLRVVNPNLTDAQIQQHYNSLYGAGATQTTTQPPPTIETYSQAVKTVNPNLTSQQIQQQYQSLYGAGTTTPTVAPTTTQIPQTLTEQRRLATSLGMPNFTGTLDQMQQLIQKVQQPTVAPTTTPAPATQYQNLLSQTGLLKTGARGTEISELQQFLNSIGFSPGAIDSIFGAKTLEALKQFQKSANITADGVVGPQTRKAIQDKLGEAVTPPTTPTATTPADTGVDTGPGVAESGTPNQKDWEIIGILQEMGVDVNNPEELASAFGNQPARTFEEVYKDLYDAVGLDKIKNQIDTTIAKLKEVDDKHNEKVKDINENPWISESLRAKKINAENTRHESERKSQAENLKLLQHQFDQSQDEIKYTANQTLDQFYKERKFEQDEKERIYKRAEDELASRRKISETEAKTAAKEDRELTISEAQKMNVPFGTKLSEVKGRVVPTKKPTGTTKTSTTAGVKFDSNKAFNYFNSLPKSFKDVFTRSALTGGAYTFTLKEVQDNYTSWQKSQQLKTPGTSPSGGINYNDF